MAENQPLLSPDELAALSAGISDGSLDVDTGYNLDAEVRKHDLAAEDSSLGVNVSSLDMINERFHPHVPFGHAGGPAHQPTDQPQPRPDRSLSATTSKTSKPPCRSTSSAWHLLRGYAMVVIEPTVVFSSLDSFFGGFGRGVGQLPPGRLFTPTETRIIKIILQVFFRSFKEAWSPVAPIDFRARELGDQSPIRPDCR
jgi:flagellar motor switch protein FliM